MASSDLGKLFIGGISWDTDEDKLKEYFGNYGEVMEAVIMRDRATGRARGFGFIVFTDPAVAQMVIMEKHMIDGRLVEAKKAVPRDDQQMLTRTPSTIHGSPSAGSTKKIFVGGLPSTVTENDFKIYFDQFGTVTDVVVMYDHNTQRPRGFGFITYDTEDAVDRVLHKTFHELNGKMVECKRAVPKELSPGPTRSPLLGYNQGGLSRTSSFLNSYGQGYNINSVGGLGVRMDSRFSHLDSGRSGFQTFGSTGYNLGMNMDPSLNPDSNFGNSVGYGRMLSPYYGGNSTRYTTPIGYNGGNGRNDSILSSNNRNVWANNTEFNASANSAGPFGYLGSLGGSGGVSFGNNRANWDSSNRNVGMNASGFINGFAGYNNSGDNNYNFRGGGHGRNSGTIGGPVAPFSGSIGYEGPFGDLHRNGSTYGDLTWDSSTPELDGSGSFGYELGNVGSDVVAKSLEGYVGSYDVTSRQPNRGIAA